MPVVEPEAYLAVASRFENIELVQAVIEDLLQRLELGDDDRHWIGLAVRDEGPGFDPAAVADPLAPENLLRPGGRGIFYMRSLMDKVEYRFGSGGGTEVVLHKRIKAAGAPLAEEETRR